MKISSNNNVGWFCNLWGLQADAWIDLQLWLDAWYLLTSINCSLHFPVDFHICKKPTTLSVQQSCLLTNYIIRMQSCAIFFPIRPISSSPDNYFAYTHSSYRYFLGRKWLTGGHSCEQYSRFQSNSIEFTNVFQGPGHKKVQFCKDFNEQVASQLTNFYRQFMPTFLDVYHLANCSSSIIIGSIIPHYDSYNCTGMLPSSFNWILWQSIGASSSNYLNQSVFMQNLYFMVNVQHELLVRCERLWDKPIEHRPINGRNSIIHTTFSYNMWDQADRISSNEAKTFMREHSII